MSGEGTSSPSFNIENAFKAFKTQFDRINIRLNFLESSEPPTRERTARNPLFNRGNYEEVSEEEEEGAWGRGRNDRRKDSQMGSIKMKILEFQGKNDPEGYLEWERKVDYVFDCHNYSEEKKVKLAVVEFTNYASICGDQLVHNRRRYGERPVRTWEEVKRIMRKRFVPNHYQRDIVRKLQTLTQGSMSVEEYFQDMEISLIRANIEEDPEFTIGRFLAG